MGPVEEVCSDFISPEWRKEQVIDGVKIQASKLCNPDNPADIAAFVKGTNGISMKTLMETQLAATIASSLNDGTTLGLRADLVKTGSITADVLLVAKSPRLKQGSLTAERVFVVPGPIKLETPSGITGGKPAILGLDPSFFSMGFCGPVLFPSIELGLDSPGVPKPLSLEQAGYGSDRKVLGLSRTTMRVPVTHLGRQSIQMLACSHFEPPTPPPPVVTPVFRNEVCNGLDDTGDGRIDETVACNLNSCSACIPVSSCGARRCVSVPDGCGGLLVCSCP
jgi:hypothetical protein